METVPPPTTNMPSVRSYKAMALTSWILLAATACISVIPVLGFGSWLIAVPVLITTLVLGILILTRGGTLQGILILLATVFVVPLFILIAPIATTAVVGAAANSGNASSTTTTTRAPSNSTQKSYRIGDTITFDDSRWVVIAAQDRGSSLSGGSFSEPKQSSGKFVLVKFTVTNTKNEEEQIVDTPKLVDSKGRKFDQLDDAQLYLPDDATEMTLEQLPSGLTKTFYAIYEVPQDANGSSFEARSLGFNPDHALVSLNL